MKIVLVLLALLVGCESSPKEEALKSYKPEPDWIGAVDMRYSWKSWVSLNSYESKRKLDVYEDGAYTFDKPKR